jgi:hypothetical protein
LGQSSGAFVLHKAIGRRIHFILIYALHNSAFAWTFSRTHLHTCQYFAFAKTLDRRWKGAGGVVAAGFLGNDWQIDEETAFLQRYFSSDHVVP